MTGLSVAYQLLQNPITYGKSVLIIEREKQTGLHSSGRNSGVIHAGVYYKPRTLKASVCVSGGRRLVTYIKKNNLSINNCGKVIVPQAPKLEPQLDELYRRGCDNGATISFIDSDSLKQKIPLINKEITRALWSPKTCVVSPQQVVRCLTSELVELGAAFLYDVKTINAGPLSLLLNGTETIEYGYLFNCAGAHAIDISAQFGIGSEFKIIPFKGIYWDLKDSSKFNITTNLYPVPDLDVPFLGVHFTPDSFGGNVLTIGPTATLAFGRQNYSTFDKIELLDSALNFTLIAKQYISNKSGFRSYVHEQSLLWINQLMIRQAQQLIPSINVSDIVRSSKVGIRAQAFNCSTETLVDDFICLSNERSTHVINSVSPAFTASFSLGELIIERAAIF